jgi:hypothetical protein
MNWLTGAADWIRSDGNDKVVLAVCTGVIAMFTAVLAIWTIRLWGATKRLANAQEQALTELERPQVFVEVVDPGITMTSNGLMTTAGRQFEYHFVNYGRTAAELIELRTAFLIEAVPAMAYPIDASQGGGRQLPVGVVSGPDKPYRETENLMAVCDVARLLDPDSWKKDRLFFIGWVRYRDIFANTYITGFCSVRDPLANRFVLSGDQQYNYTRRE